MTVDIKTYVVGLLESYQKRSKQIDLLHYELSHPTDISENEMISALALCSATRFLRISDKINEKNKPDSKKYF